LVFQRPVRGANLKGAALRKQNLHAANFEAANFSEADLGYSGLRDVNLTRTNLNATMFGGAEFHATRLVDVDISQAAGIGTARHNGPSTLSIETIRRFRGNISSEAEEFLRGCGLTPWEVECARLHDEALTAGAIAEILSTNLFSKRASNPISFGGIFISYSHADANFALQLHSRLYKSGFSVWLDRHDMVAGSIERQVANEIRLRDIVLIVLSETSVRSDWVEHELALAREKEKEEQRDVLCPVAVDDAWKSAIRTARWRHLGSKFVVDFSDWNDSFEKCFEKLLKGLRANYTVRSD
jgi:hypothetical protein